MRNLLASNFSRLRKNKVFWFGMAVMLIWAVTYMRNGCRQALRSMPVYRYGIDHYYFFYALPLGMVCAVFTSLFLGTEYSDGAIRNKLIIGHTRIQVYLAGFLTCYAATLLMLASWLLSALVALPVLGAFRMGTAGLTQYLLLSVLLAAAYCAIFTLVAMLAANKTTSAVFSMLLFLILLSCGSSVYNRLNEEEMTSNVIITTDSGMQMGAPEPNPDYISGPKRTVYEWLLDLLPGGQATQLEALSVTHPVRMLILSGFLTVFVTAGGLYLFCRKDLK